MGNRKVFIILINYNSYAYTRDCLQSLLRLEYDPYEIIVVDHASVDGSLCRLKSDFKNERRIAFLQAGGNLGFAGGNNLGIRYALEQGGELFLLLNNDTETEPDFLSQLMKTYRDDCIYTPKICYDSDREKIWYAAGEFDRNRCVVKNGRPDKRAQVSFASGCCMLFSKEVIDRIGLMREDYFMYYEDAEYSLRAAKEGIRIIYIPDSVVYHKVGKSSGGEKSRFSVYYTNRNRFYLIREYRLGFRCILYTFCTRLLRVLTAGIRKNNDGVILRAYWDFCTHRKGRKDTL